jgi:hypothetical protein
MIISVRPRFMRIQTRLAESGLRVIMALFIWAALVAGAIGTIAFLSLVRFF